MCGFIITNMNIDIKSSSNVLKHRGPDHTGLIEHNDIKMLFNRLSIIDLSVSANQPFKHKNYIIIFNGEIYNYLEIKNELIKLGHKFITKSDTEVLLKAYLQWGKECLKKLEGMFAFCIYNKLSKNIFVARDRYGIKPLFYYKNKKNFMFASEKKALFNYGIKKKLNIPTILNFINRGVYQDNKNTFFDGINILEPGKYIDIKNGNFSINKWNDFDVNFNNKIKYDDAKYELDYLIKKSLKLSLRSDKNIALSVSGGADSSMMIYKLMEEKLGKNITHLAHWTCDDENDEQKYAKSLSKLFNKRLINSHFDKKDFFPYLTKCLNHLEEPFGGLTLMAGIKMCEELKKKKIRVLLDGNGIDEILGGYQHHINAHNDGEISYASQPIQGLNIFFPKNIINKKFLKLIPNFKIQKRFNNSLKDSMLNDLAGSKLRRCLLQGDHMSMSQSIETRYPFLNNELVNFCLSLPNNFLVKKKYGKYIFRDLSNDKIFWENKRPSQTPQTKWFRKFILDDLINKLKKDDIFFDLSLFNKKELLNNLSIWKNSDLNNSAFPWYFLMTYRFIKNNIS